MDTDHRKADLKGCKWASGIGQQESEGDPRVRSALEGPTPGREEPTALLLRDAECRVAPVQDGALGADAAFAQHLTLLWVQRAQ